MLVLGAIAAGIFAWFFLWSIDSKYTFAAFIPLVGGLLLAVPAAREPATARPWLGQVAGIAAWLTLAAAIVLGAESPRPALFFWAVGAAVGLFLAAAILRPGRSGHAVAGLVVVFVLVRWSSYDAFATFGGADAFRHLRIIDFVLLGEQKASLAIAGKYHAAPGFHLSMATVGMVTGLDRSDAMFWGVLVAQLAIPLAAFALARRWGEGMGPAALVAVLATESGLMEASLHPIPGGFALPLVVPLAVGLFRRDAAGAVVFAVAGIAAVLTHHMTTAVAMAFAGVFGGWVAFHALRRPRAMSALDFVPIGLFLLLVLAFVLVHAVLAPLEGVTFFSLTLDNLAQGAEGATPGAGEAITLAPPASAFSGLLYQATLVLGSALVVAAGARWMVDRDRQVQALGVAGLVILALAFGVPFLGIDLVADRWLPVVFVLGLLGMGALLAPWSDANKVVAAAALVGFVLLGITHPAVTHDHVFYSEERSLAAQYDEPDIAAASLAGGFEGRRVFTDVAMVQFFRAYGGREAQLNLPQANATAAWPEASLVVIRADLLEQGRLHFEYPRSQRYTLADAPSEETFLRFDRHSRVLDTGTVITYAT